MKRGKSKGNANAAGEWFDRLPLRVEDRVWEAGFGHFVDTLARASLRRATIRMEPSISDKKVRYESIISQYKKMPREHVEELDVDVVARAFLFHLLSTTLFINHGNDADLALLPPLQDLDATRFRPASTRSSVYRACSALMRILMRGLSLKAEPRDSARAYIATARRGSIAIDHLATFVLDAYAIFVRIQLLVHVPPPSKFDPFAEVEEIDRDQGGAPARSRKHVRRGSDSEALDMAVIIGRPEHGPGASFSFILEHIGQAAQVMLETHLVSPYRITPLGCTHRASMAPPAVRGQQFQRGELAGHGAGHRPVIVEETEESGNNNLEETASYAS
ncbi:hypothetical protein JCGZ_02797 [Jatropha curcas]|uniref:Uncharacterized protein n=1 Tax=Jatropha curcas TaxID=180498 RepID=A0A067JRS1_JATCU|nr:hypothetical protein JCGZ_02797 [Jatropha curcas]